MKNKTIIKGDFRLVGICKENNIITDYIIYNEKFCSLLAISKNTIMSMIEKHKFVNVSVHNNEILCTDCSLDMLIKYNITSNNKIVASEENKIYILGYIFINNELTSYKCITSQGILVDLTFDEIKNLLDNKEYIIINAYIFNGKLVINNENSLISIIKATR